MKVGLVCSIEPADGDDPVAQAWKGRRVRILKAVPAAVGGQYWEAGAIGTREKAIFRESDLRPDRSAKGAEDYTA